MPCESTNLAKFRHLANYRVIILGVGGDKNYLHAIIRGLKLVAAAVEADIETENHAMSTVVEYKKLIKLKEL